jgi:hypothetical protein
MSDDYDDPDEPGGLWDPDAISPPQAPRRPTLHAVPLREPHDIETSSVLDAGSEEKTLVRLDQFRPASHDEDHLGERPGRLTRHRILVVAAVVIGIGAMLATAVPRLISEGHYPTKPAAITALGPDVEQAALTRSILGRVMLAPSSDGHVRRTVFR